MKLSGDYWVPELMTGPGAYLRRSLELQQHFARLSRRRSCVQAGGHIGIWPRVLSGVFAHVYTFEPEAENFACLTRNAPAGNVYAARGFLGDRHGGHALEHHGSSTGGHQVGASGPIPTWMVDDLALKDCDAMFIDVEGFEAWVIMGAMKTIARCRPLLVLEENKQMLRRGRVYGDLERMLAPAGYRLLARVGEDVVLGHGSG
jgi:FkbM family methyltransferase